jgi:cold shock CspA family protein
MFPGASLIGGHGYADRDHRASAHRQGVWVHSWRGGIEHFFHRSAVRGAVFELLREGQRVEFTPEESAKGPRAGDIRLIEG